MRAVFLPVLLAIGCGEKAVELHLIAPTGDVANTDLSCVNSVHVILHDGSSDFFDLPETCITVENPTSYADLEAQLRGKFEMELPDEIVAVEIRGQAFATEGATFCGTGMNVFYAGEEYTGGDLNLRIEGTMDCSAIKTTGELKVHPIDLVKLANTPAGSAAPECSSAVIPGDIDIPPSLVIGAIRPTNIDLPDFDSSVLEFAELPGALNGSPIAADGTATVPPLEATLPTSCLAAGSLLSYGVSCIYPTNPRICASAGEVELPYISSADASASVDGALYEEFPSLVHGIVYDSVLKKPVAGATVSLGEGRGVVVYARPTGTAQFAPITGDVTDASGMFLAYMREPSVATVTQGASTKAMRIGGVSFGGSAVIVPLR